MGIFAFRPVQPKPVRMVKGEFMAENSPLAELLGQSGNVFSLAGRLGQAFKELRDSHPSSLDSSARKQIRDVFDEFWGSISELKVAIEEPVEGFEEVADWLKYASVLATRIQPSMANRKHIESVIESFVDLISISQKGLDAVRRAGTAKPTIPSSSVNPDMGESHAFSCLDRFPATLAGHVGFLEFVRDEVRYSAEAKRNQFACNYSNETLDQMVGGILWGEAGLRIKAIGTQLDQSTVVASNILRRELTVGTVEQIDRLFYPQVESIRDAYEFKKTIADKAAAGATRAGFVELLNRVIRRLKFRPETLQKGKWKHAEALNPHEINAAAKSLGLGPILEVGQAPDWAKMPNLPPDHPANTRTIESLTVYHPDGSKYRVRRDAGMLDDSSGFPIAEIIARLEAWSKFADEKGDASLVTGTLPAAPTSPSPGNPPQGGNGIPLGFNAGTERRTRSKQSTQNGDARVKLIAALSRHHGYVGSSCTNKTAIGNNKLAEMARVSKSTASAFIAKQFGGRDKYQIACRQPGVLIASLKLLNQDFAPKELLGDRSPDDVKEAKHDRMRE